MWVKRQVLPYGANHPTVARLQIQSLDLLTATTLKQAEVAAIVEQLLELTARVISLEEAAHELRRKGEEQYERLKAKNEAGKGYQVPHLHTLPVVFEGFFYGVKNAIRDLGELMFLLHGKRFADARAWCRERNKPSSEVERYFYVRGSTTPGFKNLGEEISKFRDDIEMICRVRNALEHPGGFSGTIALHNFEASKEGIAAPWFEFLGEDQRYDVDLSFTGTCQMLLELIERVVVTSCMFRWRDKLTALQGIPLKDRDPKCPIAFRLVRLEAYPEPGQLKEAAFGVFGREK